MADGAFQTAPRPLIRWGGVAVIVLCLVAASVLIGGPLLRALNRWADGEAVDWMGFAAVLGALGGFLGAIWSIVGPAMAARHAERLHEIREGRQPAPFAPSPPSGGESEINPHGGPDTP